MSNSKTFFLAGVLAISASLFVSVTVDTFLRTPRSEITVSHTAIAAGTEVANDSDVPRRLIIPSLNINTGVQSVGVSLRGNMAVPTNYSDVGWYRYGAVPGTMGSAVIAGHLDNGAGLPAVFSDLDELEVGDEISIINENGQKINFVVTDVVNYGIDEIPLDIIFNRNDSVRLNLITCSGDWTGQAYGYDERTVVYTVLK